jgi:hypothetical protein
MQAITIIHASERRSLQPEQWAPAFRLLFWDDPLIRESEKFCATDRNLTFSTEKEADDWSDREARRWCAERYPGLPVNSN